MVTMCVKNLVWILDNKIHTLLKHLFKWNAIAGAIVEQREGIESMFFIAFAFKFQSCYSPATSRVESKKNDF